MLLQEQVERKPEAALGETARAAVTCRATIRKQLGGRFALIDILSMCRSADQHGNCAEDEQTAPPLLQRHKFRRYLHAPVALRRNKTALVMSNKRRRSQPIPQSRVMVEQRQKGGNTPDRLVGQRGKSRTMTSAVGQD